MSKQVQHFPLSISLKQLKRLLFKPRRLPKSGMLWFDRHYELLNPQLKIWLAVNDRRGLDIARRKYAYSVIVFHKDKIKAEYFAFNIHEKYAQIAKKYASVEVVKATEELLQQMKELKERII